MSLFTGAEFAINLTPVFREAENMYALLLNG